MTKRMCSCDECHPELPEHYGEPGDMKPIPEMKDGEPCNHPGCLSHISHPCEGCGRIGGRMKPIPEMSKDEINRDLAERLGLCWHAHNPLGSVHCHIECSCGKVFCGYDDHEKLQEHCDEVNPDFYSDPGKVTLLREMDEIYGTIVVRKDNRSVSLPASMLLYKDGILAITILNLLRRFDGNS